MLGEGACSLPLRSSIPHNYVHLNIKVHGGQKTSLLYLWISSSSIAQSGLLPQATRSANFHYRCSSRWEICHINATIPLQTFPNNCMRAQKLSRSVVISRPNNFYTISHREKLPEYNTNLQWKVNNLIWLRIY